jgi:hypothetical protein
VKRYVYHLVGVLASISLAIGGFAADLQGPEQPIPYSHKQHIALGLNCQNCHENHAPGDAMSFPATSYCMTCHQVIKKDSPAIQKLSASDSNHQEIPWVRVNKLADYVYFSHVRHLTAGIKCEDCHGQVAQRDRLFREIDLSMAGCMNCHHERNAPQECDSCHEAPQATNRWSGKTGNQRQQDDQAAGQANAYGIF